MASRQSIWSLQNGKAVLLSLCAVALESSLVVPASGQNVEPSSIAHGESLLVSGQIRSALWSDPSLSALARQIHILASPEVVVLRGTVAVGEKSHIEAVAREYAGARQIENQQTVDALAPRPY